MAGLRKLFEEPGTPAQRRYEAIRSVEVDGFTVAEAAKKFGYTKQALYSYIRDIKANKLSLFPESKTIYERRTPAYVRRQIIKYRNKDLSATDIRKLIEGEGYKMSVRTVERIIEDSGLPRLKRRTQAERGFTKKKQMIPQRASILNFKKLEPRCLSSKLSPFLFYSSHIF